MITECLSQLRFYHHRKQNIKKKLRKKKPWMYTHKRNGYLYIVKDCQKNPLKELDIASKKQYLSHDIRKTKWASRWIKTQITAKFSFAYYRRKYRFLTFPPFYYLTYITKSAQHIFLAKVHSRLSINLHKLRLVTKRHSVSNNLCPSLMAPLPLVKETSCL